MRALPFVLALSLSGPIVAAERPHVLFIAVDDLNDWVGSLGGHPQAKTPHMDRLARAGTVFRNAHCQAPLCNPSRASLLTGLRPSTTGVYALDPWFRSSPRLADLVTLPQYFERHGYRTLSTGKIFHDAYPPREDRTDGKEFTVWGYHGSFGPLPAEKLSPRPGHRLVDWGVYPARDEEQEDWKVADWAIDQLKTLPGDQPFFLCVGFRRPHVPCFASQKWFDLYPEDTLIMPPAPSDDNDDTPPFSRYQHWKLPEPTLPWLKAHHQWRPLVRAYLASVSFVDSQIGRVVDALHARPELAERTVIVLWSDHGWHLGEKGFTGKTSLWERSTHVPLIFAGPGVTPNGQCDRPAELLDIYPTLIELCGLPAKPDLEGHSLVPQLKDAAAPREWPAITTHGPDNHGIRTERWRYIRYADGSEELYDMKADPYEWTNLAHDPRYAETRRALARWIPKKNARPIPGSKTRLIEIRDGAPWWEGEPIDPNKPEP